MTDLICIVCPRGCHLKVDEQNGYTVTGNSCPKGAEYGRNELVNPTRVLTSIVKIDGAIHPCCPVKTSVAVPKGEIKKYMEMLRDVHLVSPVKTGDTVVGPWIVTKTM